MPSVPAVPGPEPSGPLDEATMNALAGAFFAALPGQAVPTLPGGASSSSPAAQARSAAGLSLPYEPETALLAGLVPAPPVAPEAGPASAFYFLDPATSRGGVPGSSLDTVHVPDDLQGEHTALGGSPSASPPSYAFPGIPTLPTKGVTAPTQRFSFLDRPTAAPGYVDAHPAFDVQAVRRDFPILSERVNGHPLVWFDNAATTQKPRAVIDRISSFYEHENSNIHRAAHELAARSTDAYEKARKTVADFLGASSPEEIVFVRGATEGLNLIAQTWGRKHLREGDEILLSHLEHHANIVPWLMLTAETGAVLKVIPVDDAGQLLMGEFTRLLSDRTKLVSVTQVSNALGTVTPVQQIVEEAHRAGAVVIIDGAQSVPHTPIDVQAMGPDFFVFSGHKIFGPTGIGVVYGTEEILQDLPPWQGGGNMIADVTFERAVYQPPPGRFEAGTGNIADAVGLGAALDYVQAIGMESIAAYEHALVDHATACMRDVPGLRIVGTAAEKASVVSFVLAGYEPIEVGQALNDEGIAVRAGHHCAQPILRRMGLEATVRPSFAFYNTVDEIDRMVRVLHRLAADRGSLTRR